MKKWQFLQFLPLFCFLHIICISFIFAFCSLCLHALQTKQFLSFSQTNHLLYTNNNNNNNNNNIIIIIIISKLYKLLLTRSSRVMNDISAFNLTMTSSPLSSLSNRTGDSSELQKGEISLPL